MNKGASLQDQAGQASPGANELSPPSGDHPSREMAFSEEFPHLSWLLKAAGGYLAVYAVFGLIAFVAGLSQALWFCGGFLVGVLAFLWEAGSKAIAMEAATAGETVGLDLKGDSAGRQASPNATPNRTSGGGSE